MCKRWILVAYVVGGMLLMAMPASALVAPSGGGRGRPPVAPVGWTYQWIPPSYQTVTDRVWVGETRQLVPDMIQTSPGRWEQVWREVIIPGHWDFTSRRVMVSPGFWQLVRLDPPVPMPMPRPVVIVGNPGTVPVEGYSSGPGEDLSKFSPLTEWPKK